MDYSLKNTLNSEATENRDKKNKDLSTQVKERERRKRFEVSECFSVCEMYCVSSLFIEKIHN